MGSVGKSASDGRNTLCTWWAARLWLDTRFEALKLGAQQKFVSEQIYDPIGLAIVLRRINLVWKETALKLKTKLLPQRQKRGKYAQVRTVAEKSGKRVKTRPAHSKVARKKRGLSQHKRSTPHLAKRHRSRRSRRSHHPFNPRTGQGYVKIKDGPGRPRVEAIVQRRKSRERNAKKERRRKHNVYLARLKDGKKIYVRLTPAAKKTLERRKKERIQSLAAARKKWHEIHRTRMISLGRGTTRFHDDRPNHRTELAYLWPHPRQRSATGKDRHYHRVKAKFLLKLGRQASLLAHRIYKGATKAKHLRGYWAEVKELRSKGGK